MTSVTPAPVAVDVPASCANLGPGFDSLAAAVDVRLTVRAVARQPARVRCEGEGADELPTDDTNLIWRCFAAYCERRGSDVPDVSLQAVNAIPLERGLGSSAAAAVAGCALARAVTGAGGTDQDLLDLAAEAEGHADNAAAALLGGIVACGVGGARRFDPAPGLRPVVCVPSARQSTHGARAILPEGVTLADAAASAGRAALVLAGLTGSAAFDPAEMVDVLHEPPRFTAMPETGRLVGALRERGLAACLSGAGPAVLAVGARGDDLPERIRSLAGPEWQVRALEWDLAGAMVQSLPGTTG